MAVLKYKNGSTWTALDFAMKSDLGNYATKSDLGNYAKKDDIGPIGTLNQQYPIGSFYYSPVAAIPYYIDNTSNYYVLSTYNSFSAVSPATIYGGTWTEIVLNSKSSFIIDPNYGSKSGASLSGDEYYSLGVLFPPTSLTHTFGQLPQGSTSATVFTEKWGFTNAYLMSPRGGASFGDGITVSNIPVWKYCNNQGTNYDPSDLVNNSKYRDQQVLFYCRIWQRVA